MAKPYFWQISTFWITRQGAQIHNSYSGVIEPMGRETRYALYMRILQHLHNTYQVPEDACISLNHLAPNDL
jgi:hypothetical protein